MGGGDSITELFVCGNPPYLGYSLQNNVHKDDLKSVLSSLKFYQGEKLNYLDYIAGWLLKAAEYGKYKNVTSAFVATNSICQGISVSTLWPLIFKYSQKIQFAYTSFKWSNLASNNAGVSVVIIGLTTNFRYKPTIFSTSTNGTTVSKTVDEINPYLLSGNISYIRPLFQTVSSLPSMELGNTPRDGGQLNLNFTESKLLIERNKFTERYLCPFVGAKELVRGTVRKCLWIEENNYEQAIRSSEIMNRLNLVRQMRQNSKRKTTKLLAELPHQFAEIRIGKGDSTIIVPSVTSENRPYLPVGLMHGRTIVSNSAFAIYDSPLWSLALIASKIHLVWIGTVCGRLGTGFRYSNTLGWNTFPVPKLTSKNKEDLTRAAENILLAREEHFPATIADLYKPDQMPENLRIAHEHNDEIIERIFIGRRFKNDTERLEKLFELYSKMTNQDNNKQKGTNR